MKIAYLLALLLGLGHAPAAADAPHQNASQHPRIGQIAELSFAPGSRRLAVTASDKLGAIAAWARQNPDGTLVLDGHADRGGTPGRKIHLSLARAQAVRSQLVRLGVDPDHIVIAAYGDEGPLRRVVVWGTHHGLKVIIARTMARGDAVIWTNGMPELEQRVIATREAGAVHR
jgi:hypothetical protein